MTKNKNIYETSDIIIRPNLDSKISVIKSKFQDQLLCKIYNEIRSNEKNPTKLRTVNIFLDLNDEEFKKREKEILTLLLDHGNINKQRLILLANSRSDDFDAFLKDSKKKSKLIIIITSTDLFSNLPQIHINFSWPNLVKKSQDKLLSIKICTNNTEIELKDLISNKSELRNNDPVYNFLTPDLIHSLIANKSSKIAINELKDEEKNPYYIPRKLIRNGTEIFNEDVLIQKIAEERIFLISDLVGSGKTETLKELTIKLKIKYPNYWISFLTLKNNKSDYQKVKEIVNVKDFMSTTILKLDSDKNFLEKQFFNYFYDQKRVIFLFDGFDEINPECKEEVLKLFHFLRNSKKVIFWVTSRQHLETELKDKLNIEHLKIIPLNKKEQVEFLKQSWSDFDTNDEDYAGHLVETLSNCIKCSDFFGLPLQTFLLSQIFKEKHQRQEAVQKLNIVSVFTKHFEVKKIIWIKLFSIQEFETLYKKSLNSMQIHEFLALSLFINDREHMFNMSHNLDEWSLNDIQKCGIVTYDSEGKLKFVHKSLAEFLVAKFIFNFLKNLSEVTTEFADLFLDMLFDNNYQVVRVFFNYLLINLKMDNLKLRKLAEKLVSKINRQTHSELLSKQIKEKSTNLVDFVLSICVKFVPVTARKISIINDTDKFYKLMDSCDLDKCEKERIIEMFKKFEKNKSVKKVTIDRFLRFIYVRRLPIDRK